MIIDDLKKLSRDELLRTQGAIEILLTSRIEKEPETDKELRVEDAAKELGISKSKIYEEIRKGLLQAIHYSPKCIRVRLSDLRNWQEGKFSEQRVGN